MSSPEQGDDVVKQTTGHVLSGLEPEQKTRIVEEIADEIVEGLKQNDEEVAKQVGHAIIDQMPVVSETTFLKAGTAMAVDSWLEQDSEEIIEEVGTVIVNQIIESHSETTVDNGIAAVVEEVHKGS